MHFGDGVKDLSSPTGTKTVVLFDVFDFGILADVKTVNAVVDRIGRATIIDTAAGDDGNLGIIADVKIIINCFFDTSGTDGDGNVDLFVLVPGLIVMSRPDLSVLGFTSMFLVEFRPTDLPLTRKL